MDRHPPLPPQKACCVEVLRHPQNPKKNVRWPEEKTFGLWPKVPGCSGARTDTWHQTSAEVVPEALGMVFCWRRRGSQIVFDFKPQTGTFPKLEAKFLIFDYLKSWKWELHPHDKWTSDKTTLCLELFRLLILNSRWQDLCFRVV